MAPARPGEAEERAYEALLLERAHGVEELARLLDLPQKQVHTALDRLVEHGFAQPAGPPDGAGLPHPTAPETALHTLIHRRQAELHRRSAELARLRLTAERLAAAAGTGPGQASGPVGGVEAVSGARAIAERAGELVAGAEREVLVMDDRPHVAWLDLAAARAAEGLPVRVVLGGPGLGCPAGQRRAAALADRGLRLRAAAAGCPRGWSRWTAAWRCCRRPAGPPAYALLVAEARLRDALLPLFEAVWSGATPPDRPGGEPERRLDRPGREPERSPDRVGPEAERHPNQPGPEADRSQARLRREPERRPNRPEGEPERHPNQPGPEADRHQNQPGREAEWSQVRLRREPERRTNRPGGEPERRPNQPGPEAERHPGGPEPAGAGDRRQKREQRPDGPETTAPGTHQREPERRPPRPRQEPERRPAGPQAAPAGDQQRAPERRTNQPRREAGPHPAEPDRLPPGTGGRSPSGSPPDRNPPVTSSGSYSPCWRPV